MSRIRGSRGRYQGADLIGERFGKLVVTAKAGKNSCGTNLWTSKCDCGGERVGPTGTFTHIRDAGLTAGCADCRHETKSASKVVHGHHKAGQATRLYRIWTNMLSRCTNPKAISYLAYGARGIKVCAEWQSFTNFMKWAISNGYSDALTIERANPKLGYEPYNCEWITLSENIGRKNKGDRYWRSMTCNA